MEFCLIAHASAQLKIVPTGAFSRAVAEHAANVKIRNSAAFRQSLAGKGFFKTGALPLPIDISALAGKDVTPFLKTKITARKAGTAGASPLKSSTCLPTASGSGTTLNLNTCGYVTAVRDQTVYEDCWTFASLGSVESNLLFNGNGTWDFSENNMGMNDGYYPTYLSYFPESNMLDTSGDSLIATSYLARWAGPALASDDVNYTQDAYQRTGLTVQKHLQEMVLLPPVSTSNETFNASGIVQTYDPNYISNVKAALQAYGAGYVSFYADQANKSFDSARANYYTTDCVNGPYGVGTCTCSSTSHPEYCSGHAVTLVGWDDNYSSSNFGITPPGNGAFIAKNSWGSESTDGKDVGVNGSGYFYISYYDTSIGDETAFFDVTQSTSNYTGIYQYDTLGLTDTYPATTATTYWMANIFTASASSNQNISAVSFYNTDTSTTYNIYVYTGVTAGNPISGTLAYTSGSGTLNMFGYHTVGITPVPVPAGTNFSIVVKLANATYSGPIAIERPYYAKAGSEFIPYTTNATASSGQSYVSQNGSTWSDITTLSDGNSAYIESTLTTSLENTNVALKAFESDGQPAPASVLDGASSSAETSYTTDATQLSANWTATTGSATGYQYAIGTTPGGIDTKSWTSAGTATSVTATGLSLPNGTTYYVSVRTVYNSLYSSTATSSGQTVDALAPVMGAVYDGSTSGAEKQYSNSLTSISANWSATDAVNISSYTYAIGSTAGGHDIAGWTNAGTATSVTKNGLSLANGTVYYVSVVAYNMAGLASTVKTSQGVLVDTTPPGTPSLSKKPVYYYPGRNPSFTWSSSDNISGIAGYAVSLATATSCPALTSVNTASASSAPFVSTDGLYLFCVNAINNAGNISSTTSYQFDVLYTSPTISVTVSTPIAKAGTAGFTLYSGDVLYSTPTVTVQQTGGSATSVTMTTSTGTVWTGSYAVLSAYGDGSAVITVSSATNMSGNYSTNAATKSFIVDVTPPAGSAAISATQPLGPGTFASTIKETDNNINYASTPTVIFSDGINSRTCSPVAYLSGSTWTATCFMDSAFSSGTAHIYMSATDLAGNTSSTSTAIGSFTFDLSVGGTSGGTVVATDSTTVVVPPGASANPFFVQISSVPDSNAAVVAANAKSDYTISVGQNLNHEFSAFTTGGTQVSTFSAAVTIKLYYPDANLGSYVDGTLIPVSTLGLYYLNTTTGLWTPVPGYTRSVTNRYLSAQVSHFSLYAIRSVNSYSGLDTIRAYPNPCDFRKFTKMTITGVGPAVSGLEIRIYTLAGQLVKTFTADSGITANVATWDGKNDSGQKVASGVYLIVFRANGIDAQTFKAAIIW